MTPHAGPSSSSRKRTADTLDDPGPSSPPKSKIVKGTHPFFLKPSHSSPSKSQPTTLTWNPSTTSKPPSSLLHATHLHLSPSPKVAAFDLDGTLIKTSSGAPFPKDREDWVWWWRGGTIVAKLKELIGEGYAIVIFSNQASARQKTVEEWKAKIALIASKIPNIPFRIFAAQGHDEFRKPMPGMWATFEKINGVQIDKTASFFVGDAAGRPGDHSDTDRKFALNVGIPFFTPEEYFLQAQSTPYKLTGFDPSSIPTDWPLFTPTSTPLIPPHLTSTLTASLSSSSSTPPTKKHRSKIHDTLPTSPSKITPTVTATIPEVVLFVGYPASGKTSLYRRYFQPAGYEHINQDTLKTRAKCLKRVGECVGEGRSCVVDNTNRNVETRKEYVDLCQKLNVPIRCLYFTAPLQLCWHNNLYRAFLKQGVAGEDPRSLLPPAAFFSFRAQHEEPTSAEGFTEIKRVNFRFEGTEEERRLWGMWLEVDKVAWGSEGKPGGKGKVMTKGKVKVKGR